MSQVLELSDNTYQQLTDLAQRQQRTVEEMLCLCLTAYEEALYERAHQQMLADGVRGCQVKCVTFLHWHPVSEQNHKLIERRFPLGYGLGPFFGDML
jgi:hypothetical protein